MARALWAATAVVFYVGVSLYVGEGSRSLSPWPPMPATGTIVLLFAGLVLLPLAAVASLVSKHGRRIAQRLGIAPPDPSGGGPDEDLGAGRPGGQPR